MLRLNISLLIFFALFMPTLIWNHELFLLINGFHSPLADHIIGVIAGLGDGLISVLLIAMLMLFNLRLGLAGLLAFFLSGLITQIIKRIFEMPRPPVHFDDVHLLGHSLTHNSFPSGHATTCGMMALLVLYVWKGDKHQLAWFVFTLFVLAAYSRVYGGVHFPLDVVVGFAIGVFSMFWCDKKSQSWSVSTWQQSEWSWKLPGLFLMTAAVILGTGYQVQPATAQVFAFIFPIVALFTLMHAWKKRLNYGS